MFISLSQERVNRKELQVPNWEMSSMLVIMSAYNDGCFSDSLLLTILDETGMLSRGKLGLKPQSLSVYL